MMELTPTTRFTPRAASITGAAIITLEGDMTVLANTTGLQQVDLGDLGIVDYGTTDDTFVFTGNDITISVASFVSISGSIDSLR